MQDWQAARAFISNRGGIGAKIFASAEMPSTQVPAKEAARKGEGHGAVFVTDHQTAGRGRRDRRWESPAGLDLTFSVILRPQIELRHLPILGLAIANAVARALERIVGAGRAGLKWPNDVLIDERKLCGVICETAGRGALLDFAVAGIGINVNNTAGGLPRFDDGRPPATSLLIETGRTWALPALLGSILNELDDSTPQVETESGRTDVLVEYRARCLTLGRRVRIVSEEGGFCGIATEIEDDGRIAVVEEGLKKVYDSVDIIHAKLDI